MKNAPSDCPGGFRRCIPLLPYCLGLLAFSALAAIWLPGLKDIAAALGTAEAFDSLRQGPGGAIGDILVQSDKLRGNLPDISSLAGLILLGKISLALAALQIALLLVGALAPLTLRLALWLGLAHALFAALLLLRAAWSLWRAPDFYLECLTSPLQSFAGGGFALWLAGAAGLFALLGLAWRKMRRFSLNRCVE